MSPVVLFGHKEQKIPFFGGQKKEVRSTYSLEGPYPPKLAPHSAQPKSSPNFCLPSRRHHHRRLIPPPKPPPTMNLSNAAAAHLSPRGLSHHYCCPPRQRFRCYPPTAPPRRPYSSFFCFMTVQMDASSSDAHAEHSSSRTTRSPCRHISLSLNIFFKVAVYC